MSTNSSSKKIIPQGNSIYKVELNTGVLPTISIRADVGSSGTITVCGSLINETIDYSLPASFANPYINPTMIDYADTTSPSIVGGVITITPDTYKVFKLDVDMLNEVGFKFDSIVGKIELVVSVEDSQYA